MIGREINLSNLPKRIVSLVPSQTEFLYDLGLGDHIVGITKFCIHPKKWCKSIDKVGGTKSIKVNKVLELKPDIVIANKEENTQADIESLEKHLNVWVSDINSVDDGFEMMHKLGILFQRKTESAIMIQSIQESFSFNSNLLNKKRVCYFIWKNPFMLAGKSTFINDVISNLGGENLALQFDGRYPSIELSEIVQIKPEILFLSSEPYPFKQSDVIELSKHFPNSSIVLVDGEMFSWYGSRMIKWKDYFQVLKNQVNN